jgi:hypothetical protein
MVTPTQRYFTIEISPDAIDWSEAAFKSVQVLVRTRITQGSAPSPPPDQPSDRAFTWNTGETGSKYATYSIQDGNEVRYDWEASYIIPGQTVQTATGREALEPILNIPASPAPLTAAGAGRQ